MKRKVGDKVILNERYNNDKGKEATIHSIEKDNKGREWYRLVYKGKLDPWNWKDEDFVDTENN